MVIENKKGEGKSSQIILITGGTKSGKSEFAEYLARKFPNLTYVALSEERPQDKNWQQKISYIVNGGLLNGKQLKRPI